jgi:hypothetical protein
MARSRASHSSTLKAFRARSISTIAPVGNGSDNIFIEARGHLDASTTDHTGLGSCRLEDTPPPGVTTTIGTMTIFPVRLC